MTSDRREAIAVRPATAGDAGAMAAVFAAAFQDDPCFSWVFPDAEVRRTSLPTVFAGGVAQLGLDHALVAADLSGAALWLAPGAPAAEDDEEGRAVIVELFGAECGGRLNTMLAVMAEHHPGAPHHYLAIIGTATARQGQGVGSALIAPVVRRADEEGVPAYLESSNERNLTLYRRHGFEVTDTVHLPEGPPMYLMWRDPQ